MWRSNWMGLSVAFILIAAPQSRAQNTVSSFQKQISSLSTSMIRGLGIGIPGVILSVGTGFAVLYITRSPKLGALASLAVAVAVANRAAHAEPAAAPPAAHSPTAVPPHATNAEPSVRRAGPAARGGGPGGNGK